MKESLVSCCWCWEGLTCVNRELWAAWPPAGRVWAGPRRCQRACECQGLRRVDGKVSEPTSRGPFPRPGGLHRSQAVTV